MGIEFAAIDFETANEKRVSACSVGIAVVEDGTIRTSYHLVAPPEMRFNPFNISLHGIRPEHVANAPTFAELWPQIRGLLSGGHEVFAHWAPFDKGVLKACFEMYEITDPIPALSCSCRLAKSSWPGLSTYSLDSLATQLGVELDHHNAQSDAAACARLVQLSRMGAPLLEPKTERHVPFATFDELLGLCEGILIDGIVNIEEARGLLRWLEDRPNQAQEWPGSVLVARLHDVLSDGVLTGTEAQVIEALLRSVIGGIPQEQPRASASTGPTAHFDELRDGESLVGKNVCLTGEFAFEARDRCADVTTRAGGHILKNVTKKLDFLVIGTAAGASWMSGKVEKALEYRAAGLPIRIIAEESWAKALKASEAPS